MKKVLSLILLPILLTACQSKCVQIKGMAYQGKLNETPILIAFDKTNNHYFGKVVNNYFGTYTQDKDAISFSLGGSTMMMGSAKDMVQEQEWFKLLGQVTHIETTNNGLILKLQNGQSIALEKTKYPE